MAETRRHVDEDCWCAPRRMQLCPVCVDLDLERPECSECVGAGVVSEYDPYQSVIFIHNKEARRGYDMEEKTMNDFNVSGNVSEIASVGTMKPTVFVGFDAATHHWGEFSDEESAEAWRLETAHLEEGREGFRSIHRLLCWVHGPTVTLE